MKRILFGSFLTLSCAIYAVCSAAASCDTDQPPRLADHKRVKAKFNGDTLSFSVPSRFEPVDQERTRAISNDISQLQAWVAPATQAGYPSEMIELRSLRSMPGSPDPTSVSRLAALHAKMYMSSCPQSFSFGTLPALMRDTPGDETYAVVLACGDVRIASPRRSDISVTYVLRGAHDFYVMTWSALAEPRDKAFEIDRNEWMQRVVSLFPLTVCPVAIN